MTNNNISKILVKVNILQTMSKLLFIKKHIQMEYRVCSSLDIVNSSLQNLFFTWYGSICSNSHYIENINLPTYLCGTTTNIWLKPVEEDLSMSACLEHSASNL
jgi:hypothetical protein